ncbi:MAG: PorT family protein [Bacteroidia bacterium]|nr:PorT family protein [Bacteroidia bacterium]
MKRSLLILLLLTFYVSANAQDFKFGLTASPGFAWLKPDTEGLESDGSKIAFSYGIMGDFNFADNYAFATGIEVAYNGGKIINRDTAVALTGAVTNFNLQYIELPVTMKMKTNEIGYLTYFGRFGFVPGYLIGAKGETDIAGTVTEIPDFEDDINKFNVSLLIGAGAEYSLSGETALVASVTFKNGFLDVIDGGSKAVANVIALNIGVLF